MEVHRTLGPGLLEVIYKDALEIEFKVNNIPFEREKEFLISYKGTVLPHKFYADFIVNEDIIIEVKEFSNEHKSPSFKVLKARQFRNGIVS